MKFNIPLTYQPKIAGVIDGTIRQTIRQTKPKARKFRVGDLIAFHGWEGKPYRSKWSFRTEYFKIRKIIDVTIDEDGFWQDVCFYQPWFHSDELARLDGIDPPTGEALRDVLLSMGCTGDAQIVRW